MWLDLKNILTNRPSKKLDQQYGKYTVIGIVRTHNYCLDTPSGIHNVFPARRLRPVATDLLLGQVQHEPQLPSLASRLELEYEVERILNEKKGRGGTKKYLMKWVGY